jgi:hypothetical protein
MYLLPLDAMEVMHSHLFSPPAIELNHQSCLASCHDPIYLAETLRSTILNIRTPPPTSRVRLVRQRSRRPMTPHRT